MASLLSPAPTRTAETLVLEHRRLARHLAQRYVRTADQREDLEQVAYLGLVKAARRFDPDRGVAFTTFAVPTVLGELRRFCRDTRWAVHVPRQTQERVQELRRFEDGLHLARGRSPSTAEAAEALGWTPEEVIEARVAAGCLTQQSLDAPIRSTDGGLREAIECVGADDDGFIAVEQRDELQQALSRLSANERRALQLRGENGCSTPEIARQMGLSTPQAARLVRHAIRRLRDALAEVDPPREEPFVRLAEADPELFAGVGQAAVAPRVRVPAGDWGGPQRTREGLGLLVLTGTLLRSVTVDGRPRAELIGPGDVIRRAEGEGDVGWRAVEPVEFAALSNALCRWPSVVEALLQRASDRSHALAVQLAITDLRRAEDRLLSLFRVLADRWGTQVEGGTKVTVALTHDMIAMLVGVHRPTVTTTLRRLEAEGRLHRDGHDHWLLLEHEPVALAA